MSKNKKVIGVVGDYYHQGSATEQYIKKTLEQLDEEVMYQTVSLENLPAELAKNPDLVIFSTENQQTPTEANLSEWLTPELEQLIVDYVHNRGGSWIALHSGMSNYPTDSDYVQMLKGYFISHPEQLAVTYKLDLGDDSSEFTILDEHYQVGMVDENTHIFMRSFSDYGESVAGWRHFYGIGKVTGYVPAHNAEQMLDEVNLAIFKKVIAWSLVHQSTCKWKVYL
ncbi:hypothetical protein Hs30E_06170 [Lactococcus hodotermopsidis]|uniref:ThuA-like domain-containing protein n=1 Tax=Pseudolactococcus hodotermopsidis TaxID=2709157 RepID=A0A6A0BB62_9LACT|nr:ThuA domain-containing protein [Lactococcus hodotermopsidis]GFH42066.1 hypothetical protein Hs30E_06170 [Lactococcus hodotermopsidis]